MESVVKLFCSRTCLCPSEMNLGAQGFYYCLKACVTWSERTARLTVVGHKLSCYSSLRIKLKSPGVLKTIISVLRINFLIFSKTIRSPCDLWCQAASLSVVTPSVMEKRCSSLNQFSGLRLQKRGLSHETFLVNNLQ